MNIQRCTECGFTATDTDDTDKPRKWRDLCWVCINQKLKHPPQDTCPTCNGLGTVPHGKHEAVCRACSGKGTA